MCNYYILIQSGHFIESMSTLELQFQLQNCIYIFKDFQDLQDLLTILRGTSQYNLIFFVIGVIVYSFLLITCCFCCYYGFVKKFMLRRILSDITYAFPSFSRRYQFINQMESNDVFFCNLASPFEEFSNYYPSKFNLKGKEWSTTEHYFQAMKFEGTAHEEAIRKAETAEDSKKLGYTKDFPLREDWQEVKYNVMKEAHVAKFSQNEALKQKLLSTGTSKLTYNNPSDSLWGIGDGSGKNWLGQIIMEVRDSMKS